MRSKKQANSLPLKPPHVVPQKRTHQDSPYWPIEPMDLCSCWFTLDDATEENGCLQEMPRHHSHYFDHRLPDGTFAGMITETVDDGRFGPARPLPAARRLTGTAIRLG